MCTLFTECDNCNAVCYVLVALVPAAFGGWSSLFDVTGLLFPSLYTAVC